MVAAQAAMQQGGLLRTSGSCILSCGRVPAGEKALFRHFDKSLRDCSKASSRPQQSRHCMHQKAGLPTQHNQAQSCNEP